MNRLLWLLCLAVASPALAQSDWGIETCRHGRALEVIEELSQDEGGTRHTHWQFDLADGGSRVISHGNSSADPPWPVQLEDGGRAWGFDDCRSLRQVKLPFTLAVALPEPSRQELAELPEPPFSLEQPGFRSRTSRRHVEVRVGARLLLAFDAEVARMPLAVEGFDVGDRRHVLLVSHWVAGFNEGAPWPDQRVDLVAFDGTALPSLKVGAPPLGISWKSDPWEESARWAEHVAVAMERLFPQRAKPHRAFATMRRRQVELRKGSAFKVAEMAWSQLYDGNRDEARALAHEATVELHRKTLPTEWALTAHTLCPDFSDCFYFAVTLGADAGTP